jgi:hypothetical protein
MQGDKHAFAAIVGSRGEQSMNLVVTVVTSVVLTSPFAVFAAELGSLQTLVEIGSEKNTPVAFPLPIDVFSNLGRVLERLAAPPASA